MCWYADRDVCIWAQFERLHLAADQVGRHLYAATQAQVFEGMNGDAYAKGTILVGEVGYDQDGLILVFAQEGEVAIGVESACPIEVGIGQIVETTFAQCCLASAQGHDTAIVGVELLLLGAEVDLAQGEALQ